MNAPSTTLYRLVSQWEAGHGSSQEAHFEAVIEAHRESVSGDEFDATFRVHIHPDWSYEHQGGAVLELVSPYNATVARVPGAAVNTVLVSKEIPYWDKMIEEFHPVMASVLTSLGTRG